MARRRRPGPRVSVVEGRAVVIIPIESVSTADDEAMSLRSLERWLAKVTSLPSSLGSASSVSLVFDRFAFDLHVSDVGHATDVHTGDEFVAAAPGGIDVYVVDGVDPRRSSAEDLDAAARSGRVVGAAISAYEVDLLDS